MINTASIVCRGDKAFLVGSNWNTEDNRFDSSGFFVVPFGDCTNGKVNGDSKPSL